MTTALAARLDRLDGIVGELGSVLVAFSGGADSALVLAIAVRRLGQAQVAAATGVSDSLAAPERQSAEEFAASLGVRWYQPGTHELRREGYRRNAGDRCYHCKSELMSVLAPLAAQLGLAHVATGTNADDMVAGFRPGIRAAHEAGARAPLAEAGLSKADVRASSAALGLPTWDKPAAACLSSRIAYGLVITPAALSRVERSEAAVREVLAAHGVAVVDLRVRDLGADRARIELDPVALASVSEVDAGSELLSATLRDCGFAAVAVAPFRSGSMNDVLADQARAG